MSSEVRRSARWALSIAGLLGILCAVTLLPASLRWLPENPLTTLAVIDRYLPRWTGWQTPPNGLALMIASALCVLLLIAGRLPARIIAALAAAWFVFYVVAATPGSSYWTAWMANTGNATPLIVAYLVSLVAFLALSVLALWTAARLGQRS
jgi:hypothetical protein